MSGSETALTAAKLYRHLLAARRAEADLTQRAARAYHEAETARANLATLETQHKILTAKDTAA